MSAPESFERFVASRTPALLRTAYLLTGDHHDAEDLVQTALIRSVGAWGRIRGNPEPYVRRILVHESISRWRRRRWRETATQTLPETGVADADVADRVALRAALATLAPRQRTVVVLRYYDDLTERETAELMGIAVGTVKSTARDALARLRVLLPDAGPGAELTGRPTVPGSTP